MLLNKEINTAARDWKYRLEKLETGGTGRTVVRESRVIRQMVINPPQAALNLYIYYAAVALCCSGGTQSHCK